MDDKILSQLEKLTEEEQRILSGTDTIDRSLYMEGAQDIISGHKLLEQGKLMAVRPHTRFVHFPKHRHNYVEVIYMCKGSTTHIIDGNQVVLEEGDTDKSAVFDDMVGI